ncbi:MAG: hypothetical protein NT175_13365 [Bacteroidetes bacterium]|nr:hypothetical protein [Bacteroidota bacterium]
MNKRPKILISFVFFAVAMAFLESAVVIYLRALYYPGGFDFPLKLMDPRIAGTEIFREAATIIMLLTAGIITGRNNMERFGYFILGFGIWDIFYYLFLKIILNWPESLMTWDILFLIPSVWVGPVLCSIINSLTMILLALLIIHFTNRGKNPMINITEWILLIAGSLVIITSYTEEYIRYVTSEFSLSEILSSSRKDEVLAYAFRFIPQKFNWYIFAVGAILHIVAVVHYFRRWHLKSNIQ